MQHNMSQPFSSKRQHQEIICASRICISAYGATISRLPVLYWLELCISKSKAFCTDGDIALVNALQTCIPNSIGLWCFLHKTGKYWWASQRSFKQHKDGNHARHLWTREGETFSAGLIDVESKAAFDVNLDLVCISDGKCLSQVLLLRICPRFSQIVCGKPSRCFLSVVWLLVCKLALLGHLLKSSQGNPKRKCWWSGQTLQRAPGLVHWETTQTCGYSANRSWKGSSCIDYIPLTGMGDGVIFTLHSALAQRKLE